MTESGGGVGSQAAPGAAAPLTRGFLFADLRGYTAYMDQRGATAGALLVDRFRGIVRAAVALHQGAEIRTEGDSFYVVFPSASMAVACALDIVRAAADDVVSGDEPIAVGVGVHAGEALETPDGPVGTAVNIAARLCAMARPGEVVVSDTVRALTRSVGAAGFVPLGRRPIKGLDEALTVYRAVPAGTTIAAVRAPIDRRRLVLPLVGLAAVGIVGLAAIALARPPAAGPTGSPHADASATASTRSSPFRSSSPLANATAPGSFTTSQFALPFTIHLGEGWHAVGDLPDLVAYGHDDAAPSGWIDVILVAATLDPPCGESAPQFIGQRPEDVIDWLATRPWLQHDAPRPYNVGRYLGRAVEVEMTSEGRSTCANTGDQGTVQLFRLGLPTISGDAFGALWGAEVGERKLFVAIDVDGRTVTLVIGSPFEDVERFWALSAPLLQTIEFVEPPS